MVLQIFKKKSINKIKIEKVGNFPDTNKHFLSEGFRFFFPLQKLPLRTLVIADAVLTRDGVRD